MIGLGTGIRGGNAALGKGVRDALKLDGRTITLNGQPITLTKAA